MYHCEYYTLQTKDNILWNNEFNIFVLFVSIHKQKSAHFTPKFHIYEFWNIYF